MHAVLKDKILYLGLFSFIVITTVSSIVTTHATQEVVYLVRPIAALFVLFVCAFISLSLKISRLVIISLFLFTFYFLYSIAIAGLTVGMQEIFKNIGVDFFIIFCGIYLFGTCLERYSKVLPDEFLKIYILYTLAAFSVIVFLGGFEFGNPPKFVFDVGSDLIGREETYGLMLTGFFMLSAIFSLIAAANARLVLQKTSLLILLIFYIMLSIFAGGRGEFIFGLLLITYLLFTYRGLKFFSTTILIFISVVSFTVLSYWNEISEKIISLQRFNTLFEGDLSSRDLLLANILDIFVNEPLCLLTGCGQGFFQYYHDYEFGLYPHNSLAEAIVIFGIPLLFILLLFALIGLIKYYRKNGINDPFLILFIYSFLISLKSGYLFGSWMFNVGVFIFMGIGFEKLIFRKIDESNTSAGRTI